MDAVKIASELEEVVRRLAACKQHAAPYTYYTVHPAPFCWNDILHLQVFRARNQLRVILNVRLRTEQEIHEIMDKFATMFGHSVKVSRQYNGAMRGGQNVSILVFRTSVDSDGIEQVHELLAVIADMFVEDLRSNDEKVINMFSHNARSEVHTNSVLDCRTLYPSAIVEAVHAAFALRKKK